MMGRTEFADIAEKTLVSYREREPQDTKVRVVRMTSGTSTGHPLVFIRELPETMPGWFDGSSRAAICGGNLPWRLGVALFFKNERTSAASSALLIDAADFDDSIQVLLEDYMPDTYVSFPSILSRLAGYMSAVAAKGVRALILTGESLRTSAASVLQSHFSLAQIRMQYLIQEAGFVGHPAYCPHLRLHHYHPAPGVSLRLLEPDESGAGELLVTVRFNDIIDLKDYAYGDLARIDPNSCPCGAASSFEIVGRSGHDLVRMLGATLHRDEFDRVANLLKDAFEEYRADAFTEEVNGHVRGVVELAVWSRRKIDEHVLQEICKRFMQELFVTPTRTYGQLVDEGIFLPIRVRTVDEPFPKRHKDLRIRGPKARI